MAISDPLHLFAQPVGAFSQHEAVEQLKKIHREEGLPVLVVGWPLTAQGEEGVATQRVQEYINRLRKVLPGTEIVTWDERYTSALVRDRFAEGRKERTRPTEKGRIDAAAAGMMLQEYLDQQSDR